MNGEDVGGQYHDYDMWLEEVARMQGIKEDRKHRVKMLSGKYVVATKGRSSGDIVFLQDRKISDKGYWTRFLSNAVGFESLDKANMIAKGFKYNNPRVAIVESTGNYKWL